MSNGMLSQEEIDALMKPTATTPLFSPVELDALGEICNISMGAAATSLSSILDKKVEITAPEVEVTTVGELENVLNPKFLATVEFTSGFNGYSVFMLSQEDGAAIIDLQMGGDGHFVPEEFNEIHFSAIAETMNQMMGSSATAMSQMIKQLVNISPPQITTVETGSGLNELFPQAREPILKISFQLRVEGLIDSRIIQVIPFAVAREMIDGQLGDVKKSFVGAENSVRTAQANAVKEQPIDFQQPSRIQAHVAPGSPVNVQPVQFAPFEPSGVRTDTSNLGLILDVPLVVSVELGKSRKTIKEILNFSPGSIIELDKLAGESVDLIANGKLLAKGEVVVINENFGLRITEILSSIDKRLMV